MPDPDAIATDLRVLLARTIERLEAMGIGDEAIATLRPARRIALIPRPAVMDGVGRAWRLGVLLLDREGRLFATGGITRAIELTHETVYMNAEALHRRDLRVAATRGGFAPGDTVNFDVAEIALDAASLESYLAERTSILAGD
jgi:hypothetical protein